jgi:FMN-dependent NADH-azoreductase
MKLLQIDSSPRRTSVSRQLTASFVNAWQREQPDGEVIHRDLAITPLPPITEEWAKAAFASPDKRTEAERLVAVFIRDPHRGTHGRANDRDRRPDV